jgi:hypothetical protein
MFGWINPVTGKVDEEKAGTTVKNKPTNCGLCGHSFKDDEYFWSGYTNLDPLLGAFTCKPCAEKHLVVYERRDL